jgi:hypothetical protein
MALNAVQRRNRTLKVYGGLALVGILVCIIYCATRPGFDLSTPQNTMDSFKRAMDGYRWSEAEKCLSAECREHYAGVIRNRKLFDFYSPYGYETGFGKYKVHWQLIKIENRDDDSARARIGTRHPLGGAEQFGFWMSLKREADGMWRITGPLQNNIEGLYERVMPEEARGWAKLVETR